MSQIKDLLNAKLSDRSATVAILGLGYVGLPLAVVFAEAGYKVIGVDPIAEKVARVNRGDSYVMDIPSAQLASLVNAGKIQATTDFAACAQADAVSICVPTPLRKTGDPDLSFIISASEAAVALRACRHGGGARIEHLSRHHPRAGAAQSDGCQRPESR